MLPKQARPMESRADMLNEGGKISEAPSLTSLSAPPLAGWLAAVELLLGWLMSEAFLSSSELTSQRNLLRSELESYKSMHPIPLPQQK